jgi:hypothetical protein
MLSLDTVAKPAFCAVLWLRSLRPLNCSTRIIFCALAIYLALSRTTSPVQAAARAETKQLPNLEGWPTPVLCGLEGPFGGDFSSRKNTYEWPGIVRR